MIMVAVVRESLGYVERGTRDGQKFKSAIVDF
jgi:hypothetical protein